MTSGSSPIDWRIGSYCESSACVEVGFAGDEVHIRHSSQEQQALIFTRAEWNAFLTSAKSGEFD